MAKIKWSRMAKETEPGAYQNEDGDWRVDTSEKDESELTEREKKLVEQLRIVQVGLRIQENVRQRLEREAKKNGRSLNAEMAHRLQQSLFDRPEREGDQHQRLKRELDRLSKRIEHLEAVVVGGRKI